MGIERLQVYKCEVCGNIVEVLHAEAPALVCCGKPMVLCAENTTDAAKEKHVPVVERSGGRIKVKVGSVAHPMESGHHIAWIEAIQGDSVQRMFLSQSGAPEAEFEDLGGEATVRAYCNLHGLWKV